MAGHVMGLFLALAPALEPDALALAVFAEWDEQPPPFPEFPDTWNKPTWIRRAEDFLLRRGVFTPAEYARLEQKYKVLGLKVAGVQDAQALAVMKRSLLESFRNKLDKAVAGVKLNSDLMRAGFHPLDPWHARLVAHMTFANALAVASYAALRDPKFRGIIPSFRYVTRNDERVRPTHAAMHNKVFARDSPIWQVWWPPNGYNCRCKVVGVTWSQMHEYGVANTPWPKLCEDGALPNTRGVCRDGSTAKAVYPDDGFRASPFEWLKPFGMGPALFGVAGGETPPAPAPAGGQFVPAAGQGPAPRVFSPEELADYDKAMLALAANQQPGGLGEPAGGLIALHLPGVGAIIGDLRPHEWKNAGRVAMGKASLAELAQYPVDMRLPELLRRTPSPEVDAAIKAAMDERHAARLSAGLTGTGQRLSSPSTTLSLQAGQQLAAEQAVEGRAVMAAEHPTVDEARAWLEAQPPEVRQALMDDPGGGVNWAGERVAWIMPKQWDRGVDDAMKDLPLEQLRDFAPDVRMRELRRRFATTDAPLIPLQSAILAAEALMLEGKPLANWRDVQAMQAATPESGPFHGPLPAASGEPQRGTDANWPDILNVQSLNLPIGTPTRGLFHMTIDELRGVNPQDRMQEIERRMNALPDGDSMKLILANEFKLALADKVWNEDLTGRFMSMTPEELAKHQQPDDVQRALAEVDRRLQLIDDKVGRAWGGKEGKALEQAQQELQSKADAMTPTTDALQNMSITELGKLTTHASLAVNELNDRLMNAGDSSERDNIRQALSLLGVHVSATPTPTPSTPVESTPGSMTLGNEDIDTLANRTVGRTEAIAELRRRLSDTTNWDASYRQRVVEALRGMGESAASLPANIESASMTALRTFPLADQEAEVLRRLNDSNSATAGDMLNEELKRIKRAMRALPADAPRVEAAPSQTPAAVPVGPGAATLIGMTIDELAARGDDVALGELQRRLGQGIWEPFRARLREAIADITGGTRPEAQPAPVPEGEARMGRHPTTDLGGLIADGIRPQLVLDELARRWMANDNMKLGATNAQNLINAIDRAMEGQRHPNAQNGLTPTLAALAANADTEDLVARGIVGGNLALVLRARLSNMGYNLLQAIRDRDAGGIESARKTLIKVYRVANAQGIDPVRGQLKRVEDPAVAQDQAIAEEKARADLAAALAKQQVEAAAAEAARQARAEAERIAQAEAEVHRQEQVQAEREQDPAKAEAVAWAVHKVDADAAWVQDMLGNLPFDLADVARQQLGVEKVAAQLERAKLLGYEPQAIKILERKLADSQRRLAQNAVQVEELKADDAESRWGPEHAIALGEKNWVRVARLDKDRLLVQVGIAIVNGDLPRAELLRGMWEKAQAAEHEAQQVEWALQDLQQNMAGNARAGDWGAVVNNQHEVLAKQLILFDKLGLREQMANVQFQLDKLNALPKEAPKAIADAHGIDDLADAPPQATTEDLNKRIALIEGARKAYAEAFGGTAEISGIDERFKRYIGRLESKLEDAKLNDAVHAQFASAVDRMKRLESAVPNASGPINMMQAKADYFGAKLDLMKRMRDAGFADIKIEGFMGARMQDVDHDLQKWLVKLDAGKAVAAALDPVKPQLAALEAARDEARAARNAAPAMVQDPSAAGAAHAKANEAAGALIQARKDALVAAREAIMLAAEAGTLSPADKARVAALDEERRIAENELEDVAQMRQAIENDKQRAIRDREKYKVVNEGVAANKVQYPNGPPRAVDPAYRIEPTATIQYGDDRDAAAIRSPTGYPIKAPTAAEEREMGGDSHVNVAFATPYVDENGVARRTVVKPEWGEWPAARTNFPNGMWRSEVAAYKISEMLGLDVVPPTIRVNATYADTMKQSRWGQFNLTLVDGGDGSAQLFLPKGDVPSHDSSIVPTGSDVPQDQQKRGWNIQLLDLMGGNQDRHGGNRYYERDSHKLWAIDNGMNFGVRINNFRERMLVDDIVSVMGLQYPPREWYESILKLPTTSIVRILSDTGLGLQEQGAAVTRIDAMKSGAQAVLDKYDRDQLLDPDGAKKAYGVFMGKYGSEAR